MTLASTIITERDGWNDTLRALPYARVTRPLWPLDNI